MTKFNSLAATLAASAVGLSLFGGVSQAQAASLVPSTEGEITFGVVNSLGYTVKSLAYDGMAASRLFVDDKTTDGPFTFTKLDAGTNPDGLWFRPVAVNGSIVENGHLEVGKFNFDFGTTIKKLKLTFFDVEEVGTLIDNINGGVGSIAVAPGDDSNIQYVFLDNVTSFDLKAGIIGGDLFPDTGDGVRFQIESVPEPTTILGLGALGVASAFGLRKGKKASQAA
ncbi:LEVG family PEP-CTERM protein [Anabaena sp. UHCC 0204]|uniref:LEVG family PEP-CTERM protein n=1 Tax=Anabaena sp. UHCC 0204 TaxID=2590009 RepID=UPI001444C91C|nr:LEVG family PEP-CTERM protein [Anabaena sp. UHCC 0204]MTJ07080.1 PEP-CTERM sorting domain-containing protein [Anabaena sp. UHCC 0204]